MELTFLQAAMPLTKTFAYARGTYAVTSYPMAAKLTSFEVIAKNITELEALLRKHAALGHALLRGNLDVPLKNESRAGHKLEAPTEWIVFDFDKVKGDSCDDVIKRYLPKECQGVRYVGQLSASMQLPDTKSFSGHIFMQLEKAATFLELKNWITYINMTSPSLVEQMTLTASAVTLHWPLDVAVARAAQIIYIAPPKCMGYKPKYAPDALITMGGKLGKDTLKIAPYAPMPREVIVAKINELREHAGLERHDLQVIVKGENEILVNSDRGTVHDVKPSGNHYLSFNINGGNSHGYFIDLRNPALIGNFKGEPYLKTEQIDPDFYKALVKQTGRVIAAPPVDEGTEVLAFYATNRQSEVTIGTYSAISRELRLEPSNAIAAAAWLANYGVVKQGMFPHADVVFDPTSDVQYVPGLPVINTYKASMYMIQAVTSEEASSLKDVPKTITKVMRSIVGGDEECFRRFVNWLAVILQTRKKTGTSWVLHGAEGCLSETTVLEVQHGKRNGGRAMTVKDLYEKFNGVFDGQRPWRIAGPTRIKSVKRENRIGFHEIMKVVDSGVKSTFTLTTSTGRSIRVTKDHPFLRANGKFTKLKKLKVGDRVAVEGLQSSTGTGVGRVTGRATTYSIPHHPYAWRHMIAGKNYKRLHTARLVVEASLNNLDLKEFVGVLRRDPARASQLRYLPADVAVHHLDEDCTNDVLENLAVVDKLHHDAHHAKETGLGMIDVRYETVASIELYGKEQTYDIVMKAPFNNYIANGFAVHNTGKGVFVKYVLRPLFGRGAVRNVQYNLLNGAFNDFLEDALIVVFEEASMSAAQNQQELRDKLYHLITDSPIMIHGKNKKAVERENYGNFIFDSNERDPVVISGSNRRFNVAPRQETPIEFTVAEFSSIEAGRELEAFADCLLRWKIDEDESRKIVHTREEEIMHQNTVSPNQLIAEAILAGDTDFFITRMPSEIEAMAEFGLAGYNPLVHYQQMLEKIVDGKMPVLKHSDIYVLFRTLIPDTRYFKNSKLWYVKHFESLGLIEKKDKGDRIAGVHVKWKVPEHEIERKAQSKLRSVK